MPFQKSIAADSQIILRQLIFQSKPNDSSFGAQIFHAPRPQNFSIGNPRSDIPVIENRTSYNPHRILLKIKEGLLARILLFSYFCRQKQKQTCL